MKTRYFPDKPSLTSALKQLLVTHIISASSSPHAIMLSGGSTPLPVYNEIAQDSILASKNLHIIYSDDRIVAPGSLDSNYGNSKMMLTNLRIEDNNIIRVQSELGLEPAREEYEKKLTHFLENNGRITLGLLGLGEDGHTASLFTVEDALYRDAYTLTVKNQAPFERVSVTSKLLSKTEKLVFAVSGTSKAEMIAKLINSPSEIPSGIAIQNHPNVEIWSDQNIT